MPALSPRCFCLRSIPFVLLGALAAWDASAQAGAPIRARPVAAVSPACAGGLVNDDGSFETDALPAGHFGALVNRFSSPGAGLFFEQICVCWGHDLVNRDTIDYELVVYAADGVGGEPGTEIARVPASAPYVPGYTFFEHDVSALDIPVPGGGFYLGVAASWGVSEAYLCTDEDGPGGQPSYVTHDGAATWSPFATQALGVRADLGGATTCEPSASTLCIDDQPGDRRFALTVGFETVQNGGVSGNALATPLSTLGIKNGGVFSFFAKKNPEMLVKVLDGCAITGHFWVFYAATTNVGFDLVVTDTETGALQHYRNPDLMDAETMSDTKAFPCP